ncbi:hypothetical protein CR164_01190 [Prosthecochloris marina]|uniref:DUF2141 domain-containing protein n=1 Tax=Prosthecochloris marina TaxID=2017681 RepID=A0A317T907_9CHLB|nr:MULTISPECIES: DUF2141 domain-containing protein [Prosthecochloris]PWW83204.1 hypothetical protein CR164_01190 [Prosthecochloris marina]
MKSTLSLSILLLFLFITPPLAAEQRNVDGTVPVQFTDLAETKDLSGPKGRIAIRIDNIRNSEGALNIALFTSEKGFPDKPEKAFALASIATKESPGEIVIENIPYGTYALSVLHDENENQKMDKTWIGKPKEGFGTSNNPKVRFGPPKFDESGFVLDRENISMVIDMMYL